MTTDFDDILNLTKKDFESKPITTIYFIKDDQVKYKIKSNLSNAPMKHIFFIGSS